MMKRMRKRVLAFILVVTMIIASGFVSTASATSATDKFNLDITASINAEDSSIIDVVITVEDIKEELYAVECLLNYDDTLVEGVYKENNSSQMDVFMSKTPTYTFSYGGVETSAPRYEQMCYYDAENSRYELRFCDLISYPFDKGGVEYKGLIEDGELVITVPFKILGEAKEGTKFTFSASNVLGTTKADLKSVSGSSNIAVYTVVTETEPPTQPTDPPTQPTDPPTQPTEATQTPTDPVDTAYPGYYLVGTLNGVDKWYVDNTATDRFLGANPEVNGEYMLDWTFYAGDEIKVVYYDGTVITAWYKDISENYRINSTEIGNCTLYFRPDGRMDWYYTYFVLVPEVSPTENTETPTNPVMVTDAGFYLVGTLDGQDCWYVDKDSSNRMFQSNPYAEGEYMFDWNFCAGDEIKVVYFDGYNITAWYKDGVANNYAITADSGLVGDCTVYFRPDGREDWDYTYFTVIPKVEPTEATETEPPTEATQAPTEPEKLLGDVDNDGVISVIDATKVQLHLAQKLELTDEEKALADTSKDSVVSIIDATLIQMFVAQLITEF